jgi:methylenetetrahydrofolate reductase (NADPH)
MQITCRDRNRIAITSSLIGAAALGIENILVLRGDSPEGGDEPEAMPVFDLESQDVIRIAKRMRDEGTIPSGRELLSRPTFHIAAADVPFDAPVGWQPDSLRAKIDAGADFIQTQFCFDPPVAQRYLERLGDFGILERVSMVIGIGPIVSARSAKWMNDNLFGVTVPEAIVKRLEGADDQAAEGHQICVELIEAYREMPGATGVHIMAPAQGTQRIADVIDTAMPGRATPQG